MKNLILISVLLLSACSTSNVQTYAEIDRTDKTITVPAGSKSLKGVLKKMLNDNGWKMSVYSGASYIEGTQGTNTKLKSYDTFLTRYNLLLDYDRYDTCLEMDGSVTGGYNYDIAIIDNKSGSEALTMNGSGCLYKIKKDIQQALSGVL